jgi:hypothetical protein
MPPLPGRRLNARTGRVSPLEDVALPVLTLRRSTAEGEAGAEGEGEEGAGYAGEEGEALVGGEARASGVVAPPQRRVGPVPSTRSSRWTTPLPA